MSYEAADLAAVEELERLIKHLGDELAAWRRRSLSAEAELQTVKAQGGVLAGPELVQSRQRVVELERENQALRARIDSAKERVQLLAGRLAFLEHDSENGA